MLKITVELLPGGDPSRRRALGVMTIANTTDLADTSDYEIRGSEGNNPLTGESAWTAAAVVQQHRRAQSVWTLIGAAAAALVTADRVEW